VIILTKTKIYGWGSNRFGQLNPHSSQPFFDKLVELKWIRKATINWIQCGPLNTYVITKNEISSDLDNKYDKILELETLIQQFKEKTLKLEKENVKMTQNMDNLYETINSLNYQLEESIVS
jgi:alpha-tubulin suppressor-like RCC1 family protein